MRASVVMALAVILYIVARWTRNEPAVTLPSVLSGLFAIFIIAVLDSGNRTQEIARGFAWLFFIVAAYAALPGFIKSIGQAQKSAAKTAKNTVSKGGTASA
jgi:hypothetical protein